VISQDNGTPLCLHVKVTINTFDEVNRHCRSVTNPNMTLCISDVPVNHLCIYLRNITTIDISKMASRDYHDQSMLFSAFQLTIHSIPRNVVRLYDLPHNDN
jgi:hypothetical protein